MNKEKFIVEYDLKSVSPTLLWSYIGTKNGLADWFADDVQNEEKLFTFFWNKSSQQAHQIVIFGFIGWTMKMRKVFLNFAYLLRN